MQAKFTMGGGLKQSSEVTSVETVASQRGSWTYLDTPGLDLRQEMTKAVLLFSEREGDRLTGEYKL